MSNEKMRKKQIHDHKRKYEKKVDDVIISSANEVLSSHRKFSGFYFFTFKKSEKVSTSHLPFVIIVFLKYFPVDLEILDYFGNFLKLSDVY